MEELDRLKEALETSQTMLLKNGDKGLTCSFISYGMVKDNFVVQDEELATALVQTAPNGIVEGFNFERLRNNYSWFSLRVKSKKLLKELA